MVAIFVGKKIYGEDRSTIVEVFVRITRDAAPVPEIDHQATGVFLRMPTIIDVVVIKEEVRKDTGLQEIVRLLEEEKADIPYYTLHQGVLKFKGRLVISSASSLLPAILHTYHDSVFGGHSGFLRTYKRAMGELYWKGMKKDIKKYCEECVVCQRNKSSVLSSTGLLMPLEIPDAIWSDISIDFIEGLPKSRGWDVILVFILPSPIGWANRRRKQECGGIPKMLLWGEAERMEPMDTLDEANNHVSQLKKAVGKGKIAQTLYPYVNENHEWMTQPEEVYNYHMKYQFPEFHLEDKVDLEEESDARPSILFTYNRRNKKIHEANDGGTCGIKGNSHEANKERARVGIKESKGSGDQQVRSIVS
ncbi:transposon Tf2-1 polyprotein isoform X1 [Cucumis melo var. makuwa]|uniref:Transposon Tf2-1 polyprotein isoform X1 n=1 Tax=Cucumis melo var. makuwa TaxID=1194695 RepID=A0A5D3C1Q8_CUCMM|nr:transposon Tf2-1 polyprotein isoform X1 [Cucumis melo var. makuwa]TYK05305.1 transposon Tf2-1 polyprotein isoform X1 [Cucumis melo var. makuwa]